MKGIEDVIDAFALVHEKYKNAELWVLGDGDPKYVQSLKNRKIANLHLSKKIKFWGFVSEDDKLKLLSKAHLLLHASVKEGWGLVVIEAASQATPAVVYNVEGLRDSVKDGVTGVVTKKNTPRDLARSAVDLIDNRKLYQELQKNSLDYAKSLSWSSVAKQSLDLLESI
jgi:glycosyltransferase involved in cell wall biosynthesis